MNRHTSINRRTFIGASALAIANACSRNSGENTNPVSSETPQNDVPKDDGSRFLRAMFADGITAPTTLTAGRVERAPFSIRDGAGRQLINDIPEAFEARLTSPNGVSLTVILHKFEDGLAAPHYSLHFDASESGRYTLETTINGHFQKLLFEVAEPINTQLVQIGEPLRSVDTPTFKDALGFEPICTRFNPCPFHQLNLADIINNKKPTALIIATPGFCQTASCGPVVDLLMNLDPSPNFNVVHNEVYTKPNKINEIGFATELLAPAVLTYAMAFEPSFIVAGADGLVTARLDYVFDRTEMAEALSTAT